MNKQESCLVSLPGLATLIGLTRRRPDGDDR
jgi:hypothetical protein